MTSEDSNRDQICKAIQTMRLLRFRYKDDRIRIVEPHLAGENTAHHDTLVAWLSGGEVIEAGYAPGWRSYLVNEIHGLEVLDAVFHRARPAYDANDTRMVKVYCCLSPP